MITNLLQEFVAAVSHILSLGETWLAGVLAAFLSLFAALGLS